MDTLKIDNIIVKSFSGHASREENSYLETWLDLSDANRRYYEHVLHVLETLKKEKANEFEIPDINGEWEKLKNSIHLAQRRKNLVFLRIAAIFVIILGTSFLFMYNSKPENKKSTQVSVHKKADKAAITQTGIKDSSSVQPQVKNTEKEEYKSGGVLQELMLADNSKVILDPNAKLVFKNEKSQRQAFLEGSALFHVRHEAGKDFLVSADKLDVRVTGTIFEVRESANKKKIDIFVEEGQVEVFSKRDKSRMQVIHAGECYVYNVKQDKFHQKNTSRIRFKIKRLRGKFQNFFLED